MSTHDSHESHGNYSAATDLRARLDLALITLGDALIEGGYVNLRIDKAPKDACMKALGRMGLNFDAIARNDDSFGSKPSNGKTARENLNFCIDTALLKLQFGPHVGDLPHREFTGKAFPVPEQVTTAFEGLRSVLHDILDQGHRSMLKDIAHSIGTAR